MTDMPEVRLPTLLRPHVEGAASVTVHGATVGEVFADLAQRYPGLAGQLVADDGNLHKFLNVYRNDVDVSYLDRLDTKVAEDDVISILPAVAGG
jgi:molybdopterin converting factor small subunit